MSDGYIGIETIESKIKDASRVFDKSRENSKFDTYFEIKGVNPHYDEPCTSCHFIRSVRTSEIGGMVFCVINRDIFKKRGELLKSLVGSKKLVENDIITNQLNDISAEITCDCHTFVKEIFDGRFETKH